MSGQADWWLKGDAETRIATGEAAAVSAAAASASAASALAAATGPWTLQRVTKSFTAANLVACAGGAPQLILAGVTGYVYVPAQMACAWWKYRTTHLTGMDAWIVYITLGTGTSPRFGAFSGEIFGMGVSNYFELVREGNFATAQAAGADYYANTGIYLRQGSGTLSDPGGADDSLIVDVFYYKVPTGLICTV